MIININEDSKLAIYVQYNFMEVFIIEYLEIWS